MFECMYEFPLLRKVFGGFDRRTDSPRGSSLIFKFLNVNIEVKVSKLSLHEL